MRSPGAERVRLKNVADILVSNVDKKSVEGEAPVHLCNYTDAYYNEDITWDLDFMEATASRRQVETFGLRAGDVLITKDSETADDIGVPAFVPERVEGVVCGYHLAILRARRTQLDPRFLFWIMASTATRQELEVRATGVTRYGLRLDAIGDLEFELPPYASQRALAEFLDRETHRIDDLIVRKQSLIDGLRERRRSVVFQGSCGLLDDDAVAHDAGLPWAPEVRSPWRKVKIKHVAKLGTGHTPSRSRPEYWEDCTIPWITTGEIQQVRDDRQEVITETREKVSELGIRHSPAVLHPKGTVVLCRTASAGFSAIMGDDMATSQDFVTWTCSERLLPRYLLTCLRAMRNDLLGRLAFGSTHETIYIPDIEELEIPLPPVEEQKEVLAEIDRRLEPIDGLADRLETQIDRLREYRQGLITAAVTGQIDIGKAA